MLRLTGFLLSSSVALLGTTCVGQPAPPVDVSCDTDGGVRGSLRVNATVKSSWFSRGVDVVSFMVARADDPERWPFLQYSSVVGKDGVAHALLTGLQPGLKYKLMARCHEKGTSTGYWKTWSDVKHLSGECTASEVGQTLQDMTSDATHERSSPATFWIEVFRHHGRNYWSPDTPENYSLPDYLEAHNSADLFGSFSSKGTIYTNKTDGSFTRYCVEAQEVALQNVTTVTDRTDDPEKGGYPVTSHFADYLSCSGGNCFCMAYGDRRFRQPRKELEEKCPGCTQNECMCHCPKQSLDQSLHHIGMIPTSAHADSTGSGKLVIDGRWFSHPAATACPVGAKVGDQGCTWATDPLTFSVSDQRLLDIGVFSPSYGPADWVSGASAAFWDLGAKPCGQQPNGAAAPVVVV